MITVKIWWTLAGVFVEGFSFPNKQDRQMAYTDRSSSFLPVVEPSFLIFTPPTPTTLAFLRNDKSVWSQIPFLSQCSCRIMLTIITFWVVSLFPTTREVLVISSNYNSNYKSINILESFHQWCVPSLHAGIRTLL
jgi:hypothetical protein